MSAATQSQEEKPSVEERSIRYIPIGGSEEIEVSMSVMSNFIAHKTRSGLSPDRKDLVKFMMLCKANQLNPWTGDAYLIGFDTQGGPQFNMIVAAQALYKRAELNKDFDGIEGGIIVRNESGEIEQREGDFYMPKDGEEELLGGWAKVYRKNISKPIYEALRFSVYSTNKSRWVVDPSGMISKCAKAAALRKAFPNTLSECYTREEMDHVIEGQVSPKGIEHTSAAAKTLKDVVSKAKSDAPDEVKKDEPSSFNSILKKIGSCKVEDADGVSGIFHEIAMDESLTQDQREELVARLNSKTGE